MREIWQGRFGLELDGVGLNSVRTELHGGHAAPYKTARQLADSRGDVGPWLQLGHQLADIPIGHPGGPLEDSLGVLASEVRRQPGNPAQVQPAVVEHLDDDWIVAGGTRHCDAQIRFVLTEEEDPTTVIEHGGARFPSIQTAALRLSNVGYDFGLDTPRLSHEPRELVQKFVVSNVPQVQHGDSLGEMSLDDAP